MSLLGGLIDTRRFSTSSVSVVLHTLVIFSIVIGSYLHVEPLAEPSINVQLISTVLPPPPAPPPPPPLSGPLQPKQEVVKKPEVIPQDIQDDVQPQEISKEITESVENQDLDGAEGGIKGGVPGGVPDGVLDGTPGGQRNGIPGGPLDGVLGSLRHDDQPIYLIGDVRPPERTTFVRPEYPELARKARAQGKVLLEIVVGTTGEVEEVRILRSDPLFDQAAVEAVRKWRYQPALQGGRPVRVYLTVKVDFELH